jgi:radical SAM protein with 4Fe4S-binding SPASM domain
VKPLSPDALYDRLLTKASEARTPHTVLFELTYGCNLRCLHCSNPTHKALAGELHTDEVCAILKQLADMGVMTVCFTGGELFTRRDIFEILEEAHRLGFLMEMISNATRLTPEIARRLAPLRLHHVCFSIYGATESTYEQVTAQPGSYRLFLKGLECAASHRLPVAAIRMPVMTLNVHEIKQAKALVERFGFKFQYCYDIFPRTDGHQAPIAFRLSPEQKARVSASLAQESSLGVRENPCTAAERFIDCACGQNQFAITPYGEMNLCTAFPIPRYNLRTGSVREGWEVLKETVDVAQKNRQDDCRACPLLGTCQQKRSHAWLEAGDVNACLPHYKEWAQLEAAPHVTINPRGLH